MSARHLSAVPGEGGVIGQARPRRPLRAPISHVGIPHPSMQPAVVAAPAPTLFDWADHTDRPALPLLVATSLTLLVRNAKVPGSVQRPALCEAADVVHVHFLSVPATKPDDCNAHSIPRPGGAS